MLVLVPRDQTRRAARKRAAKNAGGAWCFRGGDPSPRGEEFEKLVREKKLEVIYLRPLDLSIRRDIARAQGCSEACRRDTGSD